jgi:hypothetical protein
VESSYRQEQIDNGRVHFTVTPAPITRPRLGMLWPGALLGGLPFFGVGGLFDQVVLNTGGFIPMISGLVGAWLGWSAMGRLLMWKAKRIVGTRGGSFIVSESGIDTTTGTFIARGQLHRILLRNGVAGSDDHVVTVSGGSLAAQFGADNVARGAAYRAAIATNSWNLCAEAGGRSTTLAGGMNEVTAFGLLSDVSKILGVQVT